MSADVSAGRSFPLAYTFDYLSVGYMHNGWEIEIEPEVRRWLDTLSDRDHLVAEHAAERLLDAPTTLSDLSEPYARHLGDGLRELRRHERRRPVNHARWKLARERKAAEGYTEPPEVEATRMEIRMAFDLGQAVYDRRTELGISQTELARRARMTQPQVSKLELGGTVPTLPLLARLAGALDASLNIALDGDASSVAFIPHAA